ncbi:MAG: glycine betaine/L-proline ABC transporter substrate-binding protein ProX [Alphaproteobacteria bacterium]|nr:glycine betaine/L-proline ABC transporter substrate-binding protein ProX [Alphaproteobacteria bacterium]
MTLFGLNARIVTLVGAAFIAGIGFSAQAEDLPGSGKEASPARPNWDSFWFGQAILDKAMVRLGYEVDAPKTLGVPAIFTSMSHGELHYMADTILPNHAGLYEKTEGTVRRIGPLMSPGTIQGYAVDKKTADAHNIRYLEDLLDPNIARLFDQDGDGRADMIGPNPDWTGSSAVVDHHMTELGLKDSIKVVQGNYTTLSADAVGRFKGGDAIFIYTWFPNPVTMDLLPGEDLVWLELKNPTLPKDQWEQYQALTDAPGCANPCDIGWLPTTYYIAASEEWAKENPAAVAFFERIKMKLSDRVWQNGLMKNGEKSEEDISRHADIWIEQHRDEFEAWIAEAIEVGSEN